MVFARNRKTGLRILGRSETVPGTARIYEDAWEKGEDGSLEYDFEGETDMHWDGSSPEQDADGNEVFIDVDYNECSMDDIELYNGPCGECDGTGKVGRNRNQICVGCNGSGDEPDEN
jgi:hypothetical protein